MSDDKKQVDAENNAELTDEELQDVSGGALRAVSISLSDGTGLTGYTVNSGLVGNTADGGLVANTADGGLEGATAFNTGGAKDIFKR